MSAWAPSGPSRPSSSGLVLTDAVDKVGDEQRAGNNRIQVPSFLNLYCAPDSYLDSMLLTRPSKNVYRQHRPIAVIGPVGIAALCLANPTAPIA
jgi:hypothetical protein